MQDLLAPAATGQPLLSLNSHTSLLLGSFFNNSTRMLQGHVCVVVEVIFKKQACMAAETEQWSTGRSCMNITKR